MNQQTMNGGSVRFVALTNNAYRVCHVKCCIPQRSVYDNIILCWIFPELTLNPHISKPILCFVDADMRSLMINVYKEQTRSKI